MLFVTSILPANNILNRKIDVSKLKKSICLKYRISSILNTRRLGHFCKSGWSLFAKRNINSNHVIFNGKFVITNVIWETKSCSPVFRRLCRFSHILYYVRFFDSVFTPIVVINENFIKFISFFVVMDLIGFHFT